MCTKCDYQTNVKENLNVHMKSVHTVEDRKNVDMRPPSNKMPCDFNNPLHSTSCCDRKSGYTKPKLYSRKEKQENGFCRLWNSGYCRMGDVCKFLHEECPKCYYQERCQDPHCPYYHYTQDFLDQGYVYREEEFPHLRRNQ